MDSITTTVLGALDGLDTALLLVIPAALAVTAVTWGTPRVVKFFKGIAK